MRKIAVFISACVLAAAFSACAGRQNEKAEYIGIEAARQSALTEAGVDEADAEFTVSGLDNRDGVFYYQIDFVSGSNEYKYAVDALTGVIIGASISIQDSTQDSAADTDQDDVQNAVQDTANNPAQDAANDNAQSGTGNDVNETTEVGSDAGINTELGQSGFSGSEETGNVNNDVPLESEGAAESGSSESAPLENTPPESTQAYGSGHHGGEGYGGGSHNGGHGQMNGMGAGGYFSEDLISVDEVNNIVLKRVPGASADDIKLEMDHDDGRILYEGELIHDGIEFEFKIDAYSGSVIEWEAEFMD